MNELQHFIQKLLHNCDGSTTPDGRPLYRYRCTDPFYATAKVLVETHIKKVIHNNPPDGFPSLFCIYAAETWKRCYREGPWSYSILFNNLSIDNQLRQWPQDSKNQYTIRHDWIVPGLTWWKRPLHTVNGNIRYLATIACEGGFPIQVICNGHAYLSAYLKDCFKELDKNHAVAGFDPYAAIQAIAQAKLPASLRQTAIYSATTDLVKKVLELRGMVPDEGDRLLALDTIEPAWRRNLPISGIDDEILKQLIDPLIRIPPAFKPLCWRYILINQPDNSQLMRLLELPRHFTGAQLSEWFHPLPLTGRMRLVLEVDDQKQTIAHLTRVATTPEVLYRCDSVRNAISLVDEQATRPVHLWLSDGSYERVVPAEGKDSLNELPWVFTEKNGEYCWVAEGSARVKDTQAWIALPAKSEIQQAEGAQAEEVGSIPVLDRTIHRIEGAIKVAVDGDTCDIHCSAPEAEPQESFTLRGPLLAIALNESSVYIGRPSLYRCAPGAAAQAVVHGLEWRSTHDSYAPWQTDFSACWGTLWLRYRDTDGRLRFRQRVTVLPLGAAIEVTHMGNAGTLTLSGLHQPQTILAELPGIQVTSPETNDPITLNFHTQGGLPATVYPLRLQWQDGRHLTLKLPIPCRGAAFVGEGYQAVQNGGRITLRRLGAVRAVAQGDGGAWMLEATAAGADAEVKNQLWYRLPLTPQGHGRSQIGLYQLQESLESMMALVNRIDPKVRLTIQNHGHIHANLTIARFDALLTADELNNRVLLTGDIQALLEEGWENRIQVRMIRLWEPLAAPVILTRQKDTQEIAWRVPDTLESGPWWILGLDGGWARFRPLPWYVNPDADQVNEVGEPGLTGAIREPERDKRHEQLRAALAEMANDSQHPDWPKLFAYIQLADSYPASTLDVLRCLARAPETLAMALLKSSEDQFGQVWSLAHHLPFAWHLISPRQWIAAAGRHFGSLKRTLAEYNLDSGLAYNEFTRFKTLGCARQKFFDSLCAWLQRNVFPYISLSDNPLQVAQLVPSFFEDCLFGEQGELMKMQERHDGGEQWPVGHTVLDVAQQLPINRRFDNLNHHRRPALCAPFVAVLISLTDQACPDSLLFELWKMRNFDKDWFDEAFSIEYCLRLSTLPVHPLEV